MKTLNPANIQKAELVVGIPSYNEAGTIGFVVEQVARGLKEFFPGKRTVIINVDNNSQDGTREAFFRAKSPIPRIYISTPADIKGKGWNFYNLFRQMKRVKAEAGIVVDADLRSITPLWIKGLGAPLFKGFDYVFPYYIRHEYDATITNHICYPLIYGLLGWDVRQPIGGDFAFSAKMADIWLEQKWRKATREFGIDIFMTLNALFSGKKVCQVNLGAKIHKPSAPNLGPMFVQVIDALFKILLKHKPEIFGAGTVKRPPLFGSRQFPGPPNLTLDYKVIKERFLTDFSNYYKLFKYCLSEDSCRMLKKMCQKKRLEIHLPLWTRIIYDFLHAYDTAAVDRSVISALRCLYLGRVGSFMKETLDMSHSQSEAEIRKQARYFFKHRDYFTRKYS